MSYKTEITITVAQLKEMLTNQLASMYPNHTIKDVRFTISGSGDDRFGSSFPTVQDVRVEMVPKNTTNY